MELAQKMFLLAAEEMNFTKAAKRAFVTQQCLSEHISKLEKQLHTKLFLRGRHLQLTESGKALVSTLQQIQHLEENLEHRIQEIEAGEIGEVRLGISTSRARLLLPGFLETFHKEYPQVHISITLGDTVRHIQLLKSQKLDLVVGLDAPADPFLEELLIGKEQLMVVGTRSFFLQYYQGPATPGKWNSGDTLSLSDFSSDRQPGAQHLVGTGPELSPGKPSGLPPAHFHQRHQHPDPTVPAGAHSHLLQ